MHCKGNLLQNLLVAGAIHNMQCHHFSKYFKTLLFTHHHVVDTSQRTAIFSNRSKLGQSNCACECLSIFLLEFLFQLIVLCLCFFLNSQPLFLIFNTSNVIRIWRTLQMVVVRTTPKGYSININGKQSLSVDLLAKQGWFQ